MPAYVVVRTHLPFVVANQHDGLPPHLHRQIVAGFGNVWFDGHEYPVAPEYLFHVHIEDGWAQVEIGLKAVALTAPGDHRADRVVYRLANNGNLLDEGH
ncbi:hypothetical protein D3C72_1331240 [compost metagenome]